MSDAADERSEEGEDGGESGAGADSGEGGVQAADASGEAAADGASSGGPEQRDDDKSQSVESLRRAVEQKYDFEDFGPADMAEMTAEEWEAAFDPETWITGEELLERVEADLKGRVAQRDVFARVERHDDRVVAYSDEGYATVYADGSVEGHGTVLRDVKPTVALASMESYDVPEAPPEKALPDPQEVPEGSGELGNLLLQVVAGIQVLAGVALTAVWFLVTVGVLAPPGGSVRSLNVIGMLFAGLAFVFIGVFLFMVVANARLSDKFRAEEYRNRLRAIDVDPEDRPDFLPDPPEERQSDDGELADGGSDDGELADPGRGTEPGADPDAAADGDDR